MNMKEKWSYTDIIYAIQFSVFWFTTVGGIIVVILAVLGKVDFPLWGVFVIYTVTEIIQLTFLVLSARVEADDTEAIKQNMTEEPPEPSEEELVEKEIQELKDLKARLKHEAELRENRL